MQVHENDVTLNIYPTPIMKRRYFKPISLTQPRNEQTSESLLRPPFKSHIAPNQKNRHFNSKENQSQPTDTQQNAINLF